MKALWPALLVMVGMLEPNAAGEVKHRFIAVDNGNNKLWHVDQFNPDKNWTVPTDTKPRDIRLSPDGDTFLISVDQGAVEYEFATGKKTGFAITNHKGIQSAQKLQDGNYLLATASKIMVCDTKGKVVKTIPVAPGSKPYIRIVTVTAENTLLYTAINPFCINEVAWDGRALARIKLPDKSYKTIRLENGNYLASSGDSVSVFEVSPKGDIVKTYGGKKNHPDLDLTFNSGWQKLANGNIVATCWHGHGYKGKGPHLVEYTPGNDAVWTWYHDDVKQITNVLVLE